jgi:hypothetical protein
VRLNDARCAVPWSQMVKLNGLIGLAGICHGLRRQKSHKRLSDASRGRADAGVDARRLTARAERRER